MGAISKKTKELRFRVDEGMHNAIAALAKERNEDIADVSRRLLREGLNRERAEESMDYISKVLRDSLRDVIKPFEERLAKLNAKTAVNTGTIQYMTQQLLEDSGHDSHDIYTKARKRAVALLRVQEGDEL